MKLKTKPLALQGNDGTVNVAPNRSGIPVITAESLADLASGLGWVHANDRQFQTPLTRVPLQGQALDEEIHSTIAGGPSDRRFSRWYTNDVKTGRRASTGW